MHPLSPDLSQLSDEELHKKYGELQRRVTQAYRMGSHSVISQMQLLIDDYRMEISERNRRQMEQMEKKAQESGRGFKGIIDIQ
jgi:hypothetical protein